MQNIHPAFVHYPIALLSVVLLFELLGRILKKDSILNASWGCQILGTISLIVTLITGWLAESDVPHNLASHELLEDHKGAQLIVTGIFLVLLIWKALQKDRFKNSAGLFIVFIFLYGSAVSGMLYGAHLGGKLVYEHGVGTWLTKEKGNEKIHDHASHKKLKKLKQRKSASGDKDVKEKNSPTHLHGDGSEHKH
ncbi:MAG: DUF2231 domain-containing protein [Spirochaetota bacterium]|nr:DUF2231 domain-containing protein [Spirochaetota bacterium]